MTDDLAVDVPFPVGATLDDLLGDLDIGGETAEALADGVRDALRTEGTTSCGVLVERVRLVIVEADYFATPNPEEIA